MLQQLRATLECLHYIYAWFLNTLSHGCLINSFVLTQDPELLLLGYPWALCWGGHWVLLLAQPRRKLFEDCYKLLELSFIILDRLCTVPTGTRRAE